MLNVKLFHITSRAANLHGYKDVPLEWFVRARERPLLFGVGGSLNVTYSQAISNYDKDDHGSAYAELALEEFFTDDEAKALVDWLAAHRPRYSATTVKRAKLPIGNNVMGTGGVPVGGGPDFLTTSESADYDLPFEAWAFFDVRGCTFDQTLP
jgi:hypothetical protein